MEELRLWGSYSETIVRLIKLLILVSGFRLLPCHPVDYLPLKTKSSAIDLKSKFDVVSDIDK